MADSLIDPIWERLYASGHAVRYPWDSVVTFVFRNAPRNVGRSAVRILEVGCGTGSNLWFAAREGFSVAGIDGSPSAIQQARERFAGEGLEGDLRVGDFTRLEFPDASFDLAIDRGSLICVGRSTAHAAVAEIHRVLKPGGRFFFNPYSNRHTSAGSGEAIGDGLRVNIEHGTLTGVGQLCFYSRAEVDAIVGPGTGWLVRSLQHLESVEINDGSVHAEWRVVVEKSR